MSSAERGAEDLDPLDRRIWLGYLESEALAAAIQLYADESEEAERQRAINNLLRRLGHALRDADTPYEEGLG